MANDLYPYYRPGDDVTCFAVGAVTGKRCVQIAAALLATEKGEGLATTAGGGTYRVSIPSAAGANGGALKMIFGVAKYDAAINKLVGVAREGIVPITTSVAVTAGASVEVKADGTIGPVTTGVAIGYACDDAGIGADCPVALLIS